MAQSADAAVQDLALPGAVGAGDRRVVGLLLPRPEGRGRVEGRPGRQAESASGRTVRGRLSR